MKEPTPDRLSYFRPDDLFCHPISYLATMPTAPSCWSLMSRSAIAWSNVKCIPSFVDSDNLQKWKRNRLLIFCWQIFQFKQGISGCKSPTGAWKSYSGRWSPLWFGPPNLSSIWSAFCLQMGWKWLNNKMPRNMYIRPVDTINVSMKLGINPLYFHKCAETARVWQTNGQTDKPILHLHPAQLAGGQKGT